MNKPTKGISFLNPVKIEEGYFNKCVDWAIEHNVGHFELIGPTHDPVRGNIDGMMLYRKYSEFNEGKDLEYIRMCERVVNAALDRVHAKGIKSYYWHHELEVPLRFDEVYPEIHNADGDVEVTHPRIKDFLENKIEDFFYTYPNMDGIVLTLHETRIPLLKLKNQKLGKVERVKYVTEILYNTCKKLGKELIVRPFASMAEDYDNFILAYEAISPDLVVCDKWTQYDWSLTMPHNTFFNKIKQNPLIVESDIFGEYFGKGHLPIMLKEHIKSKFEYCEGFKPKGYVHRIDRGGFIPFGTPNEVNLEIMNACHDGVDVDLAIDNFFGREYGEHGPTVRELMENTEDIQIMMFYINRVEFAMLSLFPSLSYLITAQKVEMFRERPELEKGVWYIPEDYVRPPLEELINTKKTAVKLSFEKLELLYTLKDKLDEEKYHSLYTRFMNMYIAARLWEQLTYVCIGFALYFETADESHINSIKDAMQRLLEIDKEGYEILGKEFYLEALGRPVEGRARRSTVPTFVEMAWRTFETEIRTMRRFTDAGAYDYVVCGGFNERHNLEKEINFSSSHTNSEGICRLAGSSRGKAWSVVKAHGWFSYVMNVRSGCENEITIEAGGFDSGYIDLKFTIGKDEHIIRDARDGVGSYTFKYTAGADEERVTLRVDRITEYAPVVYTISVK